MKRAPFSPVSFLLPALILCVLCAPPLLPSALSPSLSAPESVARPKIFSIAFVRFKAANLDNSSAFYDGLLGLRPYSAECRDAPGPCYRVNETQHLELTKAAPGKAGSFLEAIGLRVENVEQLQRCHLLIFLEYLLVLGGPDQIDTSHQVSHSLIHAGFVVKERSLMDNFYKDILGFRAYWHGGMKDDKDDWAALQVPDGTDWLEYILNISPTADKHTLGVMNHIALGVPDIKAAKAQLIKNGWKPGEEPKMGRDGKWQLNLYDPDDTRVEFMEFKPVEKPCCSEFTGPHPKP
jgi:catechol 2,3-dioxygenase-like lactoylglutathione lyase family enzyme